LPGAFARVLSYGVYGIEPYQVAVEVDVTIIPNEQVIFQIVGLPEGAVKLFFDTCMAKIRRKWHVSPIISMGVFF